MDAIKTSATKLPLESRTIPSSPAKNPPSTDFDKVQASTQLPVTTPPNSNRTRLPGFKNAYQRHDLKSADRRIFYRTTAKDTARSKMFHDQRNSSRKNVKHAFKNSSP